MAGRSPVTATEEQKAGLKVLAGGVDRAEADRARAVLLTLDGWTSGRIAQAFGVREDTVRFWRSEFMRGGIDALKASVAPGPAPLKAEAALRVAGPLLLQPVADRDQLDAGAPRRRDRGPRGHKHFALAALQSAAPKRGFRFRRPRHTLRGRQIANEIDRLGLRLKLRKAQAEAGDIVLLFSDESEVLTHPYLARAWAKRGAGLRVPAPGQSKKVAMMGALDWLGRRLIVTASRSKRSADFITLLETLDFLYGPKPGIQGKPVVIVLDNGPIHTSKAALAALAAPAHWLTAEWLPKYAPELNDIEVVWHDLKAHHLAHQTFTDAEILDTAIHQAAAVFNSERGRDPLGNQRISA